MRVVPGEQVWRLIRTDRDAPSVADVEATVGPALAFMLEPAQPGASGSKIAAAVQTDPREWRIGAARPIQVVAIDRFAPGQLLPPGPALPTGEKLGDRFEADGLPTVQGSLPWAVTVRFWWRGEAKDLPFPALRVSTLGVRSREVVDTDWYLDGAVVPDAKSVDPGDESFSDAVSDDIAEGAAEIAESTLSVLKVVGGVAIAVGLVVLLERATRR